VPLAKTAVIFLLLTLTILPGASRPKSDLELVKSHVQFLTGITPARNSRNLGSLEKAAAYIRTELLKHTARIRFQEYKVSGRVYKNVIGNFGPERAATIVIGAHYDVCGDQPGADDNASGVAGLLLLAKYLATTPAALKFNYELVFYSLEEPPYFRSEFMGSSIHANDLKRRNITPKYMLSLETIGYFSDEKDSQEYPAFLGWFYPSEGNFIAVVGRSGDSGLINIFKENFHKYTKLPLIGLAAPGVVTGIDFSDHLNYWKHGWQAAMITDTAFMRNHNYHELTDTPDTLNYDKIVEVIRGVHGVVTAK
jgi:Zn-dependent M28 family amino/carboxypeptidase